MSNAFNEGQVCRDNYYYGVGAAERHRRVYIISLLCVIVHHVRVCARARIDTPCPLDRARSGHRLRQVLRVQNATPDWLESENNDQPRCV